MQYYSGFLFKSDPVIARQSLAGVSDPLPPPAEAAGGRSHPSLIQLHKSAANVVSLVDGADEDSSVPDIAGSRRLDDDS